MPPTRIGRGRAPGKVILAGEHAVVYGWPAIALPLQRYVTVEVFAAERDRARQPDGHRNGGSVTVDGTRRVSLEALLVAAGRTLQASTENLAIRVLSEVPEAMGLGSSAALSVALIRALANYHGTPLSDDEASGHAYTLECLFHGQPSGIDNTTAAHAKLIRFVRGERTRALTPPSPLRLAIVLGKQPRQTRSAVEKLRFARAQRPQLLDAHFAQIGALVERAAHALCQGDWHALGQSMTENHALLAALGVSTAELDDLVHRALDYGARGAKLTGGGGGGAIVCLCPENRPELMRRFVETGWDCFAVDWPPAQGGSNERRTAQLDAHASCA
ncbi:MAG: mevalonate kinase [Candidatus Binatia bacterium]|nr:MAG: mevalonate kinase [Candidatus Binatia bacterium]